jgi:lysophospholipase L1-like esterase
MNELVKIVLLISSLLNLLFLGLAGIFIAKKGGVNYLTSKMKQWQTNKLTAMYDNSFYRDKKSHFEALPRTTGEIVFLGDSLTDFCEWAEVFRNQKIKNRGISGDTTEGVLNRISNIIESKPQKLFLMIGINDLNRGVSVEDVANNYQVILETLKAQTPEITVFIQSLLPINDQIINQDLNQKIVNLNAKLKELTETFSFQYINLFSAFLDKNNHLDVQYTSDGVHLNGKGYLVWQEIIEKYVVN